MPTPTIRRNGQTINQTVTFNVPTEYKIVNDILVTPALAQYILDNFNTLNRKFKDSAAMAYAQDMKLGAWRNRNGRFIAFDTNKALADGQHRLAAVVLSGAPVLMDFIFGLDPEVRPTIDTGVTRSVADQLALLGLENSSAKASTANGIKKMFDAHRVKATVAGTEVILEEFSRGLAVALDLPAGRGVFNTQFGRAAVAIAAEAHPNKVGAIVNRLLTGKTETSAEEALLKYIIRGGGQNDTPDMIGAKVLDGIVAALRGREVERLQSTRKEENLQFLLDIITRDHPVTSVNVANGIVAG